jgi:hypothetical protein
VQRSVADVRDTDRAMSMLPSTPLDPSLHECPRCRTMRDERFYGPCTQCRAELRAKFLGEGRDVEVAEYVPKMNVTPNAVALKDD